MPSVSSTTCSLASSVVVIFFTLVVMPRTRAVQHLDADHRPGMIFQDDQGQAVVQGEAADRTDGLHNLPGPRHVELAFGVHEIELRVHIPEYRIGAHGHPPVDLQVRSA